MVFSVKTILRRSDGSRRHESIREMGLMGTGNRGMIGGIVGGNSPNKQVK
jgi:hypothetical protein